MCVLITMTTLSLIFLGGSETSGTLIFDYDTLRDRVRRTVSDAGRREKVLATLDTMEKEAREHIKGVFDSLDDARDRMMEFESDLGKIESESIRPLDDKRTTFLLKMLDLRFELRDSILEDEWKEVFAAA